MVPIIGLTGVIDVAAGIFHTCALLGNGTVRYWGNPTSGQIGGSSPTTPVPFVNGAVGLAAGDNQSCALFCDGSVLCWGANDRGQTSGSADPFITMVMRR